MCSKAGIGSANNAALYYNAVVKTNSTTSWDSALSKTLTEAQDEVAAFIYNFLKITGEIN